MASRARPVAAVRPPRGQRADAGVCDRRSARRASV